MGPLTVVNLISERQSGGDGIDAQARRWLVLLSSATATPQDRAAFQAWVAADPRHGQAYDAAERVWRAAEQLTHLRDHARPEDLDRFAVVGARGWVRRLGDAVRRPAALAGGLATAAAAVLIALFATLGIDPTAPPAADYATQTAEIRDVTLADGSVVTLGARSRVDVAYSPTERRVILTEGEAFFAVVSDPARPFFVVADQAVVRVVGTRFEVRRATDRVRIAVAEGVVEVVVEGGPTPADRRPDTPTVPSKTLLTAGQQVVAVRDRAVEPVRAIDRAAPGAWRDGRLYYEEASLIEVISDANRYFDGRIDLASDEIGDLRITGSFRTDRIKAMLATLERILPIDAERDRPGRVLLKARPTQG